ncbi:hypothetical protein BDZ89DRAFT_1131959 [Hymenopellis radicata]|nr:hypothetical protein BDZ89DRAFT_1131959 [Hymenopellis radicata]
MHGLKRNSVSIRLTESAVFLRTDDSAGRSRIPEARSSLLRGLLILELVKPTKITSIELKLQATSSTSWPEGMLPSDHSGQTLYNIAGTLTGFGARRADVTEKTKVFSISAVLFNAEPPPRRTASVGPGVAYLNEEPFDDLDDDHRFNVPRARSRGAIRELDLARSRRQTSMDGSAARRDNDSPDIPPYSLHPPNMTPPGSFTPLERPTLSPSHSSYQLETVDEYPTGHTVVQDAHHSAPHTPLNHSAASSHRRRVREPISIWPKYCSAFPQLSATPMPGDPIRSPSESRGRRKGARFSLSSVSNVLFDAVTSPRIGFRSKERETSAEDAFARGRSLVKGAGNASGDSPTPSIIRPMASKERISQMLGDMWKSEADDHKTEGNGWKEFKAGTYTYPISFTIPGNAPPTMQCNYGSVSWSLSATVHRLGAFTSKLEAQRDVVVVSCPTEEDTEDTENIIVERHWDSQLQYLITISGRSFYIAKMKIHRLSVIIEEKTEYLANGTKVARTDPATNVILLAIKHEDKKGVHQPILPLESDDPEAFRQSPLHTLIGPEDDISEMASSLMGPGPWSFHQDLKLPNSCRLLHFSNKNKKSNIVVSHVLKCIIRVESGDPTSMDPKTGKKKLFDIVVQTPVHILSCRCNPEWTSLPHYTRSFEDPASVAHQCPCQKTNPLHLHHKARAPPSPTQAPLEQTSTRHSIDSDSGASAVESHPVDPNTMRSLRNVDSVMGRTNLYERLVSGREGVSGEAPPAYESVPVR